MEKQKKDCENLYQEYNDLLFKTRMEPDRSGQFQVPGRYIKSEDEMKKCNVAKELVKNCKKFLSLKPGEWMEINRNSN